MQNKEINPKLCPLCGQPNQCVMAKQKTPNKPCWCRDAIFPEELLKKVPKESQQKACICENCLKAFNARE